MIVLTLLLTGAMAGLLVQPFLSDAHRSRETRELSQAVTGMLVTLAALVLGLLTSSVKQSFDAAENDLRAYAATLIELDQTLRNFGAEAQDMRRLLRVYTASAIARTLAGGVQADRRGNRHRHESTGTAPKYRERDVGQDAQPGPERLPATAGA